MSINRPAGDTSVFQCCVLVGRLSGLYCLGKKRLYDAAEVKSALLSSRSGIVVLPKIACEVGVECCLVTCMAFAESGRSCTALKGPPNESHQTHPLVQFQVVGTLPPCKKACGSEGSQTTTPLRPAASSGAGRTLDTDRSHLIPCFSPPAPFRSKGGHRFLVPATIAACL